MSTPEERDASPEIRIGDQERERAVTHLGTAFGEGRLDLAEYDERVAAAYGAKTASELLHLTADLPLASRAHPAGSAAEAAQQGRPWARNRDRQRGPSRAGGDASGQRWIWQMWATYASVVSVSVVIWLIISVTRDEPGLAYPWPLWVAGPWGALLLFQTVAASMARRGPGDTPHR